MRQNLKNQVDVLFLVDNSGSMLDMQSELQSRIGQLLRIFSDLAAHGHYTDLHVGVVTSDYGAGGGVGVTGCAATPGGDRGVLQALGKKAPAGCMAPTRDKRFIEYVFNERGGDGNLPDGQDLERTFTCMASVGAGGCGYEHPLESVYAALHDDIVENRGFLRPDAVLAVAFLANEDDGSAPRSAPMYDGTKDEYGGLEYRPVRYGVVCGEPGALPPNGPSMGPLEGCRPAPNPDGRGPGMLYDVSRYIDFFTKPRSEGGVKDNPEDVVLFGIDALADAADAFEVILATSSGTVQPRCDVQNESCKPTIRHACQNPQRPAFFGDPAVRLNTVIRAARYHGLSSICDDDYSAALQRLGELITIDLGMGCVPAPLTSVTDPDCVVTDVTAVREGGSPIQRDIERCDRTGGETPCWRLETKDRCARTSPDGVGVTIDRGGEKAPPNTTARVSCATLVR